MALLPTLSALFGRIVPGVLSSGGAASLFSRPATAAKAAEVLKAESRAETLKSLFRGAAVEKMPGLSPAQKLANMGKGADELRMLDRIAKQRQFESENIRQETEARERSTESFWKLGKTVFGVQTAMLSIPLVLGKFSRSVLDSNEGLKRYDGKLAGAYAQLKHNEMLRDIGTARATSGTGALLVKRYDALQENQATLFRGMKTGMNVAGIAATELANTGLNAFKTSTTLGQVLWLLGIIAENTKKWTWPGKGLPETEFLKDLAAGKFVMRPPLPPVVPPEAKRPLGLL